MANLFGLDMLARFAPQIFGRALSIEGIFGSQVASSGRHDHIDSHTHEMRAAMEALSLLYRLSEKSSGARRFAEIMVFSHVLCGEEARRQPDTWLTLAQNYCPPPKKRKGVIPPEVRAGYVATGLALYGAAKAYWGKL